MFKRLILLAALLVVISTFGAFKVALVAPFTGVGSILGDYIKKATILAIDEINAAGGVLGQKIELIVYDDSANPSVAATVVRRAIFNDRVIAIFGPNMSSCVLGVHEIAKQAKVPMLVGATSPSFRFTRVGNEYLFRLRADDDVKVTQLVRYAVDFMGITRPGVIYGTTDYCTSAYDVAKREFEKRGIKIVAAEQIREGDKDATGQLLKLKAAGIDGLIGLTHEPEAAVVVRQVRQLGLHVPIIGFSAWGVPAFTDLAGDAAIGVVSVQGFNPNDPDPAVQEFVRRYKTRWNEEPSDPAQAYYDGVYLLAKAIEIAGSTDGTAIAEALKTRVSINGVQGPLKCDEHHNFTDVCYIAKFDGKTWQIIEILR
jgi:branched-chain amino acid transport system substrate-binding protein